jgi:5-formyltetrahydrofolate cyclo-ligase
VNAGPDDSRSCDDAKLEARATARAARAAAFAALPDAGARVRDCFIAELLPALGLPDRRTFSAYVPMRDEIDSLPLVRSLIGRGLTAAMPCVVGPGKPLLFRRWDIGAPLADRPFGLLEPMDDAPAVEPELLLVPLLAFDRRGHRLGYGRGYYDRTLASLRARRPIVAVGLAFAAQEMLSLPVGARDQRLDWVVTEQAAIRPEA